MYNSKKMCRIISNNISCDNCEISFAFFSPGYLRISPLKTIFKITSKLKISLSDRVNEFFAIASLHYVCIQ